jgi:hypothetical protein
MGVETYLKYINIYRYRLYVSCQKRCGISSKPPCISTTIPVRAPGASLTLPLPAMSVNSALKRTAAVLLLGSLVGRQVASSLPCTGYQVQSHQILDFILETVN